MLERYFTNSPSEYSIPSNIEDYLEHDDHFLMKVLRSSDDEWAKKIVANSIPAKIFETFGHDQDAQMNSLQEYMTAQNIDFIKCSTMGRLSKYYSANDETDNKYPLKVIRESSIENKILKIRNINEATDLYEKFSRSHSVNRIHCEYGQLSSDQQKEIIKIIQS